ncbi:hypothetical protein TW65_05228 [Stemphylium lycopersici]|uniref:Uncharacterized protein n=1 Tax=Stemphylium lycopersici TaxID=183478 RepID=A0A364MUQ8_STELY|nr:hypothetical protein TW65_05228 [Stemphylium lycopersici]RAR03879.1 hypothetical protein DDE83_008067 [Stemphylium lycopersici]
MASADLQPTCEDYDSDQSDGPPEFQGRRSPNAANVSTKRSHPSDLDKEKPPAQERVPTNFDLRSDSGYSSYTAATVSSTNSAPSAPSQRSPPAAPATAAPVPAQPEAPTPPPPKPQRRPTLSESRPSTTTTTSSRPKPSARTSSQSSKPAVIQRRPTITQDRPDRSRRDSRIDPDACTDPNCTGCGPPQRRRPDIKPTQSARDVDRTSTTDTRSMRSDPAGYYQHPSSPTHTRRPSQLKEAAIVQPATTRPRRPSSAQRPMSYHGEPGSQYHRGPAMPVGYPPQEYGPPPSNSAQWRGMQQYPVGSMGPPMHPYSQAPVYSQQYPYGQAPPYDAPQRPSMPPRQSFSARTGPGPLITQPPREQQYSARYTQPQSATQGRFPQPLPIADQAYASDTGSETESSEEEDEYYAESDPRNQLALMPPPKLAPAKLKSSKPKKQQRPQMTHAHTSQVVDERSLRRMSQIQPQSLVIDDRRRKRSSKTIDPPQRRESVSRPPAPRQAQSDYPTSRGQMVVASTKADRRRSRVNEQAYEDYAIQERAAAKEAARARDREERRYAADMTERKLQNRNSKQYYEPPAALFDSDDDSESEYSEEESHIPEAPVPPRRRRPTDVGRGKGKERAPEQKTKRIESAAEDYISAQRGTREPLNDPIHKAARRSRAPSMPSHSGSSGSDRSRTNHTAVTNDNNEIRLRVDANAPLSLQFNGDMEGRTLRMIPGENGMADLVISGGRGDSVYHNSERGSVTDERNAVALRKPRRQVEEMTEGSTESRHRKRRESRVGQRPLRPRANTYRE